MKDMPLVKVAWQGIMGSAGIGLAPGVNRPVEVYWHKPGSVSGAAHMNEQPNAEVPVLANKRKMESMDAVRAVESIAA